MSTGKRQCPFRYGEDGPGETAANLPTPVAVGLRRFIYSNRFLRRILKPVNLAQMVHGHDLKSVILALEQVHTGAAR